MRNNFMLVFNILFQTFASHWLNFNCRLCICRSNNFIRCKDIVIHIPILNLTNPVILSIPNLCLILQPSPLPAKFLYTLASKEVFSPITKIWQILSKARFFRLFKRSHYNLLQGYNQFFSIFGIQPLSFQRFSFCSHQFLHYNFYDR